MPRSTSTCRAVRPNRATPRARSNLLITGGCGRLAETGPVFGSGLELRPVQRGGLAAVGLRRRGARRGRLVLELRLLVDEVAGIGDRLARVRPGLGAAPAGGVLGVEAVADLTQGAAAARGTCR